MADEWRERRVADNNLIPHRFQNIVGRPIAAEMREARRQHIMADMPIDWAVRRLTWHDGLVAPTGADGRNTDWLFCPLICHALGWDHAFPYAAAAPPDIELFNGPEPLRDVPSWHDAVTALRAVLHRLRLGPEWLSARLDFQLHWSPPICDVLREELHASLLPRYPDAPFSRVLERWAEVAIEARDRRLWLQAPQVEDPLADPQVEAPQLPQLVAVQDFPQPVVHDVPPAWVVHLPLGEALTWGGRLYTWNGAAIPVLVRRTERVFVARGSCVRRSPTLSLWSTTRGRVRILGSILRHSMDRPCSCRASHGTRWLLCFTVSLITMASVLHGSWSGWTCVYIGRATSRSG